MTGRSMPHVEIDGRAATVESLWSTIGSSHGHFTAMQVRDRKARGVDLHLARLEEGSQALFGSGVDGGHILYLMRHAIGDDTRDASLRVYVFAPDPEGKPEPSVMVSVREPASMPETPRTLQTVRYQRTLPHIKHLGGFEQGYYGRQATQNGFDEALFVSPDGVIAEGSITNIGFAEGDTIVWPDAPALHGVSMQVLERELTKAGVPWGRRTVNVTDIAAFDGVFMSNARGVAPVGRIDETVVPTRAALVSTVMRLFDAAPWDPI